MYSGVPRHKRYVRTVSFQNCEDVTCQTIEAVAEHCPRLQGLDLYGCTQVPVLSRRLLRTDWAVDGFIMSTFAAVLLHVYNAFRRAVNAGYGQKYREDRHELQADPMAIACGAE